MNCRFSARSDYDCGCKNKSEYRLCQNEERRRSLDLRTDGAAFHTERKDGALHVVSEYCTERHCTDFKMAPLCKYAKKTAQKWVGDSASCFVFECHSQNALAELKSFKSKDGIDLYGVRRPCDEKFNLIPNAGYLHVRSRYCNAEYCPYYTSTEDT